MHREANGYTRQPELPGHVDPVATTAGVVVTGFSPMQHYLSPLVKPASVALVGASERKGSLGRTVYENLLGGNFQGELYAVNPRHSTLLERPAFASLAAIGKPIDLAIIATPADRVAQVLDSAAAAKLKAAVVMSAPTAIDRAAARAWTREVATLAKKTSVRLVGPGALGVIRTDIGLNATFCAPAALPGRLALVAQSGAVATALLDFASPLGLGFSTVISLGSNIDVDFGELLDFLLNDTATDGILLFVEDVRDARGFMSALRAAARTKPVVVLKAGSSLDPPLPLAPNDVFSAAFRRAGTVRVDTAAHLFAAMRILAHGRFPRGDRLAIVSNGRGPALMAADSTTGRGVTLAKLSPATVAALDRILPEQSLRENPINVRGNAPPGRIADAATTALADANVDAVLVLHVPRPMSGALETARTLADAVRGASKPVIAAWLGAIDLADVNAALAHGGVPNFYTPETAVDAFSFLTAYRRNQGLLLEVPAPQPEPMPIDLTEVEAIRVRAADAEAHALSFADAHALLRAFGIDAPQAVALRSLADAAAVAEHLRFPILLVDESRSGELSRHRVVRTRKALERAFGVAQTWRRAAPFGGKVARIATKPVTGDAVTAVAVGVGNDPTFGRVITLGAGSVPALRKAPRAIALPPLNERLADDLIAQATAMLPAAVDEPENHAALKRLLVQVSTLVCALPWVTGLTLDPVYVSDGRARVASARFAIDPRRRLQVGYRHLAIHPYPVEMIEDVVLADGTRLHVRPIRPEDGEIERAFVNGLSEQTRYFRFFYQLNELTPQMLARFTQVDYDREMALCALAPDPASPGGYAIVAVARYISNPDHESADFAVVTGDAWQRKGVARVLMQRLIACARRRGLKRLEGDVLRENAKMLNFVAGLGFTTSNDVEDATQVRVELALA